MWSQLTWALHQQRQELVRLAALKSAEFSRLSEHAPGHILGYTHQVCVAPAGHWLPVLLSAATDETACGTLLDFLSAYLIPAQVYLEESSPAP